VADCEISFCVVPSEERNARWPISGSYISGSQVTFVVSDHHEVMVRGGVEVVTMIVPLVSS